MRNLHRSVRKIGIVEINISIVHSNNNNRMGQILIPIGKFPGLNKE